MGCQFVVEMFVREEPFVKIGQCPSRFNVRVLELIHGEYESLNKKTSLCEIHHREVFGDMLDEEKLADNKRRHTRLKFKQDSKRALAQNESITYELFKENNYGSVQSSIDIYNRIRFHVCRYEFCHNPINKKNIYKILVMNPFTKEVAEKYYFCSYECWHKIILRVGLERLNKGRTISMDKFMDQGSMT